MQYDNYERKIKKITRVLKLLFRHKIKIALGILAVIISAVLMTVAVSAFLAVQGTILSDDESYATQIVYGDDLDYSANALLCKVGYEYRAEGSDDWSEEFPLDPGNYEVRAVANAMVGKRYGEERPFTVMPKEITVRIVGGTVIYGENPALASDGLVHNDVISDADFIYNDTRTHAEPIAETVIISNSSGENISGRYVITAEAGDIITEQRPVTLTVDNSSKMYDGKPITVTEEFVSISGYGFAEGDKQVLSYEGSITNVGRTNGYVGCTVYNASGVDVTNWYRITTVSGIIEITPRVITVRSRSFEKPIIYDGNGYSMQEYDIVSEIKPVEGDRIVADTWASIRNAGQRDNTFSCYVENDEQGKSVNKNYEITREYGTLSIAKRPITVTTPDLFGVKYDGRGHSNGAFTVSGEYGLVENEIASAPGVLPAVKYAGEGNKVENAFSITIRSNSAGNVTGNYDITYVYGTLMLDKRPITVTAGSMHDILYKGVPQSHPVVTIGGDGLAVGDGYNFIDYTQATDVGRYDNKITVEIRDRNGNGEDVTDNYEITSVDGTLVIVPRTVIITPDGLVEMYDGNGKSNIGYTYDGDGFAPGHRLEVTASTSVVDAGSALNVFSEYRVVDENGQGIDPVNYIISFNEVNYITVTKRPVVVGSGNRTEFYNDELFTYDSVFVFTDTVCVLDGWREVFSYGLVKDHSLAGLHAIGQGIDADVYRNTITGTADIVDGAGNSVLGNYDIVGYVEGSITIERRPIAVIFGSLNEYYNGMYQYSDSITVNDEISGNMGLCKDHYFGFNPENVPKYKDVTGGEINYFAFAIMKGETDVSHNYDPIDIQEGTLVIRKRPVTITTYGYTGVYDGIFHSDSRIDTAPTNGVGGLCVITVDGELKFHSIKILSVPQFKDVVENGRNAIFYEILDENGSFMSENGVTISDNYEITDVIGLFNISKRRIEISTPDYTGVYNGGSNQRFEITVAPYTENSGLCLIPGDGGTGLWHSIVPFEDTWSPLKTVDEKENGVIFKIIDEVGNTVWVDGDGNYEVVFTPGKVEIAPRPIKIWTDDYSGIYDGKSHTNRALYDSGYDGLTESGLCLDHSIISVYSSWAELRDYIENGEHSASFTICDENGNVVWDGESGIEVDNYEVEILWGEVNISKRKVYLITESYEWIYDGDVHYHSGVRILLNYLDGLNFADGHLPYTNKESLPTVQFVKDGKVTNEFEIFVMDEAELDVTDNYEITVIEKGTISIAPRPITVTSVDDKKPYDGLPLINSKFELVDCQLGIGDVIFAETTGSQTDVGWSSNTYIRDDFKIVCGDDDRTDNYAITFREGTLTVTATLIFSPVDVEKPYDGTPLTPGDIEGNILWDYYSALGYEVIKVLYSGSQTVEGVSESKITELVIADANGNIVLTYKNGVGYECTDPALQIDDFAVQEGTLTVTAAETRIVEIYVYSTSTTYDGNAHGIDKNSWMLVPGFKFEEGGVFTITGFNISLTDAGKITAFDINEECALAAEDRKNNYITYTYTVNGYDFTKYCQIRLVNLDPTAEEGSDYDVLTVNKRKITLTAGSATAEYIEEAELVYDHYDMTRGSLVSGHSFSEIAVVGSLKEVGSTDNKIDQDSVDIFDASGKSVIKNYEITYVDGLLTFTDSEIS